MKKDKESYQATAREGDIVKMPNGIIGIVTFWDITCGGNCKQVKVYPLTNWLYRLFLTFTNKIWFYDSNINSLQLISYRRKPNEIFVFKCPKCNGRKQEIKDWDAYNQLNVPVGINEDLAIQQMELANQAFGPCSMCEGRGFILSENIE